jgi:hypothetical protein
VESEYHVADYAEKIKNGWRVEEGGEVESGEWRGGEWRGGEWYHVADYAEKIKNGGHVNTE